MYFVSLSLAWLAALVICFVVLPRSTIVLLCLGIIWYVT